MWKSANKTEKYEPNEAVFRKKKNAHFGVCSCRVWTMPEEGRDRAKSNTHTLSVHLSALTANLAQDQQSPLF